jgi:radical SAM superfamily enzyme YgiQ (UPF0313 family)
MINKTGIVLVNLISEAYIQRFQAPLATTILKGYINSKIPEISVNHIDMQMIFGKINSSGDSNILLSFNKAIKEVSETIINLAMQKEKLIVGFSMKWQTQDVTKQIISQVREKIPENKILFVLGNIISTFSFNDLLQESGFENVLAVVGEGEDAIVNIILNSKSDFFNIDDYIDIPNVTFFHNGKVKDVYVKRVNLDDYPDGVIQDVSMIYDSEYDVFAYETSRGCDWGKCTFCSIKDQFGGLFTKKEAVWGWKPYPVDKVLADFQRFVAQGARVFDLKDSEFIGPVRIIRGVDLFDKTVERVEKIAKGLIEINKGLEEKISIKHISVRVDTIYRKGEFERNKRRRKMFELLKEAGLKGVYVGIESGSISQLKRYCKGSTVEENREAIRIIKEIGLDLEVGFICFDGMATVQDIINNIDFIEETELYKTPSRLFGSLRIQECTSYYKIAQKAGLVGEYNKDIMTYSCLFKYDDVRQIEEAYTIWEEAIRKMVKVLPKDCSSLIYEDDFLFMKDLVANAQLDLSSIPDILFKHVSMRHDRFIEFKKRFSVNDLSREFLEEAIKINNNIVKQINV